MVLTGMPYPLGVEVPVFDMVHHIRLVWFRVVYLIDDVSMISTML